MRAPLPSLSLAAALLLGACSSPPQPWAAEGPAEPGAHARLDAGTRAELRGVVIAFEEGRLEVARERIAELSRWWGDDVHVAIWAQEIELAWRGGAAAELRDQYRDRAEGSPTPLAWLLAARLEDDDPAARLLLQKALDLDPGFAWGYYGLAHTHARAGEIPKALEALERVFELEPRHLPALRLYGWCQAQGGEPAVAIAACEAWLERSEEDLLATRETRAVVILDLALVLLGEGDPEHAEELIAGLAPGRVDEVRRLAALAAAEQAEGHPQAALETAEEAIARSPLAPLPAVQRALLLELWLGDVEAARAAWRRVLELSASGSDLASALQRFRAQLHLARLPRPEGVQDMAR